MTQKTFELYTLKEGQWQLDSVFNEKQDATNEAWRIHNEGHLDGVRIDQEEYDAATNKAQVATIMKRLKGDDKKSTTRRKTNRKSISLMRASKHGNLSKITRKNLAPRTN